MRARFVLIVLVGFTLGCRPSNTPVASQSSSDEPKYVEVDATPPKLGQVTYRPEFQLKGGKTESAGTAFVVRMKSGDKYMLTAAHLFEPAEWKTVESAFLFTMSGDVVGKTTGSPTFIGEAFDSQVTPPVTEKDVVIWKLHAGPGDKTEPMTLAERIPRTNRVWVVGSEVNSRSGQKMFECKPETYRPNGTTMYSQTQPFQLRGFSGGPIVDHDGKVVGNLLGGGGKDIIGAAVEKLRERLKEHDLVPEAAESSSKEASSSSR